MDKQRNIVIAENIPASLNPQTMAARDEEILSVIGQPVLNASTQMAPDYETRAYYAPPQLRMETAQGDDDKDLRKQHYFIGEWIPSVDPLKIGSENYRTLENYRYLKNGIEGVRGYTKVNQTVPESNYEDLTNGYQLITPHTQKSFVIVEGKTTGDLRRIYYSTAEIPATGDFTRLAILDADGSSARFSNWPSGCMGLCTEKQTGIWAGPEAIIGAFIQSQTDVEDNATFAKDKTEAVRNNLETTGNIADIGSPYTCFLVGSTRPLMGVKFYFATPNGSSASISCEYYTASSGWDGVSNVTDGTNGFQQDGTYSFDPTTADASVKLIEGQLLYWYKFNTNASCTIKHVTVNANIQYCTDIWDGVYRISGQTQKFKDSNYADYTMNVYSETPSGWYPVDDGSGDDYGDGNIYPGYYMKADGLDGTALPASGTPASGGTECYILTGFQEKQCGIRVNMLPTEFGYINNHTVADIQVEYWEPESGWTMVDNLVDGTSDGTHTLNHTGTISWSETTGEEKKTEFDSQLYYYRISTSAALPVGESGDPKYVLIDTFRGIPSPQKPPMEYRFPFMFHNRAMLCAYIGGKEGNRVDYSMMYAPDVWNGNDSSFGGGGPLYFGGPGDLTCACQVYNRFGSNIYITAIFCKDTKTYLLNGWGPTTWQIFKVSNNVGCPAPLTMDTAEIGFAGDNQGRRNVALWLSYVGPVVCDAGVVSPIYDKISNYFDKKNPECLNYNYIEKSRGWVDQDKNEYNLLIVSGESATGVNTWLAYSLEERKWFLKVPTASEAAYPHSAFRVVSDEGAQYIYAGRSNGYLMQLENGNTWDGAPIEQKVITSDQIPTEDMWDYTQIRRVKLIAENVDEDVDVEIKHYADGSETAVSMEPLEPEGDGRYVKFTQGVVKSGWSHSFEFAVSTSGESGGVPLLGWGYTFKVVREDQ